MPANVKAPQLRMFSEKPLTFLLPIWLMMQAVLYSWHGVHIVTDSYRYLAYTESLGTGASYWLEPDSVLYAAYTLFLYLILKILYAPVAAVIFAQFLVGALAVVCFYKAVLQLTNNKVAASISTLLFTFWPDLQYWHLYIHTESLFISLTVFILYFLTKRQQRFTTQIIILMLLIIGLFLRPNGFILSAGIAIYYFACVVRRVSLRTSVLLITIVLLPATLFAAAKVLQVFSPLTYLDQGQVIQGYNGLIVPFRLSEASGSSSVLVQLLYSVMEQPLAYGKLLMLRFVFFWGHIRPYYSVAHNSMILLFFIPVYTAAAIGSKHLVIKGRAFWFIFVMILLQTAMVMLIAVDWDNRFVAPLLPFVFMFAGAGFTHLIYSKVAPTSASPEPTAK